MSFFAKLIGYDTFDPGEWTPTGAQYYSTAGADALAFHNRTVGCTGIGINETADGWYCNVCGNRV